MKWVYDRKPPRKGFLCSPLYWLPGKAVRKGPKKTDAVSS